MLQVTGDPLEGFERSGSMIRLGIFKGSRWLCCFMNRLLGAEATAVIQERDGSGRRHRVSDLLVKVGSRAGRGH